VRGAAGDGGAAVRDGAGARVTIDVTTRARRSHRAVVATAVAKGEWGWLARAGWRTLKSRLGLPGGPLFATLAVTYRCNYRCAFCDLPDRARGDPDFKTLVARLEVIARRGALAVGLTGGEPLLHPRLFELIAEARRLGLLVHVNSNGSRVTAAAVDALLGSGIHSLNVSLDGATAATHDRLRRMPGSFAQIENTVRTLLARRRGTTPRIGLVMAITPENAGEVLPFARLAESFGVDAAGWLPHHEFVEARARLAPEAAARLAADLETAQREVAVVDNSRAYLAAIAPFLSGRAMAVECSAPRTHLAIAPDGQRYPCVPLMTLERGGVPLDGDLPPPLPTARDREEVCRQCWWNCHRELDLSLRTLAAPR
jgi:MoaA/NifB/PqqE/SkfB family radical SAM enzyme